MKEKVKKDKVLLIRVSDQDRRALDDLARSMGCKPSEAARKAIHFQLANVQGKP